MRQIRSQVGIAITGNFDEICVIWDIRANLSAESDKPVAPFVRNFSVNGLNKVQTARRHIYASCGSKQSTGRCRGVDGRRLELYGGRMRGGRGSNSRCRRHQLFDHFMGFH